MILDPWQEEIMEYEGNILLAKGRRIGATHIMGKKAVEYMVTHENHHPKSQLVCVSLTEDQAELIIAFATNYAKGKYPKLVGKGKDKPTLRRLILIVGKNRRILLARPVGATGDAVRGFEGQILMVDEAPKMPKPFWASAKPILATTGGKIWMWGTFFGRDKYFYENYIKCKHGKGRYKVWEKTTIDVFKNRKISESWTNEQREEALEFLKEEEQDMTRLEFAQEYMAMASENVLQLYSEELITKCQTLTRRESVRKEYRDYFLGVDVARLGEDESTFELIDRTNKKVLEHVEHIVTKKTLTTATTELVLQLERKYGLKQIFIDAYGVGTGVFDQLIVNDETKRKTIAIGHWARELDPEEKKREKITPWDLYNNLKILMEQGKIKLLKDDNIFMSLKSIQYEYIKGKENPAIHGSYKHIADGLVRAAWCSQDKSLNICIM